MSGALMGLVGRPRHSGRIVAGFSGGSTGYLPGGGVGSINTTDCLSGTITSLADNGSFVAIRIDIATTWTRAEFAKLILNNVIFDTAGAFAFTAGAGFNTWTFSGTAGLINGGTYDFMLV